MIVGPISRLTIVKRLVQLCDQVAHLRDAHGGDAILLIESLRGGSCTAQHGLRLREDTADVEPNPTGQGNGAILQIPQASGIDRTAEVHIQAQRENLTSEYARRGLVRINQASRELACRLAGWQIQLNRLGTCYGDNVGRVGFAVFLNCCYRRVLECHRVTPAQRHTATRVYDIEVVRHKLAGVAATWLGAPTTLSEA